MDPLEKQPGDLVLVAAESNHTRDIHSAGVGQRRQAFRLHPEEVPIDTGIPLEAKVASGCAHPQRVVDASSPDGPRGPHRRPIQTRNPAGAF